MRRTGFYLACLRGALLLVTAPALASPPVPVSPGSAGGAPVGNTCPTFSWSQAGEGAGYELAVFTLTGEGKLGATPALTARVPAGTGSWTPPADRCLSPGGRYAWSLREVGAGAGEGWSEAVIFEVAAPSRAEVAAALATLRRYLEGAGRGREASGSPQRSLGEEPWLPAAPVGTGAEAERQAPGRPAGPNLPPATAPLASPAAPQKRVGEAHQLLYGLLSKTSDPTTVPLMGHISKPPGSQHDYPAVWGETNGSGGVGVFGTATATTGNTIGVRATNYSDEGTGVFAAANSLSGATRGVWGESNSDQGTGVRGWARHPTGPTAGVWGESASTVGKGVFAHATATSGENFGVYALTESAAGYAGYFVGRVTVTGTLSKGGGSFKIDHPLDPANRYLSHSFVESPDMMNVYNGNVVLGDDGAAWVELPEWFEALNRDFRYQLTPLFRAAPSLHVAATIASNRFRIAGGEPGMEVSWLVTGIRQDAFARHNPILVEEDKGEQRGRYLHPEAHDQPTELAIGRPGPAADAGVMASRAEPAGPVTSSHPPPGGPGG